MPNTSKQRTRMLRKKERARARPAARPFSSLAALGSLLQHKTGVGNDIARLIIAHLPASHLVLCSMVSSNLRNLVDKVGTECFSNDLMWCASFDAYSAEQRDEMSTVQFDAKTSLFKLEQTLLSTQKKVLWLLNSHPQLNAIVRMRLSILVPLQSQHVHISGDSKAVQKVLERGVASVDVVSWRIVGVERDSAQSGDFGSTCTVRLAAQNFTPNNRKVALSVSAPVVFTVHGVPLQPMLYRCLWVMRGVRRCMHCHQRWRHMQSFDVQNPSHRVLCSLCLDLLYARETQLTRRWRINTSTMPDDKVRRVNFVNCFAGAPTTIWPAKPDRHLLKQDVADFFNCASWQDFIKNNHKHYRRAPRWNTDTAQHGPRYFFSSRWF